MERSVGKVRKKLPIGIENFEEFSVEDFYYVDKTLFIKELLQNWGKVNLFTRPRRFGKSLNMSMLKCFFEIGRDTALFEGLKIAQEKELCEKYLGKFPVISISLKSVWGLTYKAALAALKNIIGKEAMRFQFLRESAHLSDAEKDSYQRLIKIGTTSESIYDMTDAALIDSLKTLSQLLEKHYGQKGILLCFVETVNLVGKQNRAHAHFPLFFRLNHHVFNFFDSAGNRAELNKRSVGMVRDDPRKSCFADTGRSPEDHRRNLVGFNQAAQQLSFSDQVLLTDIFVKRIRTQSARKRSRRRSGIK